MVKQKQISIIYRALVTPDICIVLRIPFLLTCMVFYSLYFLACFRTRSIIVSSADQLLQTESLLHYLQRLLFSDAEVLTF